MPHPDLLPRALEHLDHLADGRWDGPPVLVGFGEPDHRGGPAVLRTIAARPLPDHPVECLYATDAPAEWAAAGLLSYGWAGRPDDGADLDEQRGVLEGPPISMRPHRRRARVLLAVDRLGGQADRIVLRSGEVIEPGPVVGRIPDVLRRHLGAPTSPPTVSTWQLVFHLWMCRLHHVFVGEPLGWDGVVAEHPGFGLTGGPHSADLTELVAVHVALDLRLTWTNIRNVARRGGFASLLAPDDAEWMDEGMLSRELMSELPPPLAMLQEVAPVVTSDALGRLGHLVEATSASLASAPVDPQDSRTDVA